MNPKWPRKNIEINKKSIIILLEIEITTPHRE